MRTMLRRWIVLGAFAAALPLAQASATSTTPGQDDGPDLVALKRAAGSFPQPVRVGDLPSRYLLAPIEGQTVLGHVADPAIVRSDDGSLVMAINRGGFKIVPDVVAAALKQHSSVADAAVVGLPDSRLGEVPVAAVELTTGADPVSGETLRAWVRDYLVAYQVPVTVKVVSALPRNAAMKASLPEVRALFAAQGT